MSELIYAFYSQYISTMWQTFYRFFDKRYAFIWLLIPFWIYHTITILSLWISFFKRNIIDFHNISIYSLLFELIYFLFMLINFFCWEWSILVFIITIFQFISYFHEFYFCFFLHFYFKFILHFLVKTFSLLKLILLAKLNIFYFMNSFLVKFYWLKLHLRVWFTITKFIFEKIKSFIYLIILTRLIFSKLYKFYFIRWYHIWSRWKLLLIV